MRSVISLNGDWDFTFDPENRGKREAWYANPRLSMGKIPVPGVWQGVLRNEEEEVGWYRKEFVAEKSWQGKRVVLRFGAVDYFAEAWLNGHYLGKHLGGYMPFSFELSHALVMGDKNLLYVRVADAIPGKQQPEIPRNYSKGKQSKDYKCVSGIWQKVELEVFNFIYISDLSLLPDPETSAVRVDMKLQNDTNKDVLLTVRCRISLWDKDAVSAEDEELVRLPAGTQAEITVKLAIERPILWELDNPHLYLAEAQLYGKGLLIDALSRRFGLRRFESRNGRFFLNGHPIYIMAALNQGFYPDSVYFPPNREFIEDEIAKHKRLGLNMIRMHLKPFEPEYLSVADEMGMLVYQESAIGWSAPWMDKFSWQVARQEILDMIRRDRHHPSVVIWGIANENQMTAHHLGETFMKELVDAARQVDPTRLIVDNSDPIEYGHGSFFGDFLDFHDYPDAPENIRRPRSPLERDMFEHPALNSEIGAWGFPNPEGLLSEFHYGQLFAKLERQFYELGMDEVFTDIDYFADESQRHQFEGLKYHLEEYRKNPWVTGYTITESYDMYWECNGLMDFNRRPRYFADDFVRLGNPVFVGLEWLTHNYWEHERFSIPFAVRVDAEENKSKLWNLNWKVANIDGWHKQPSGRGIKVSNFSRDALSNLTLSWKALLEGKEFAEGILKDLPIIVPGEIKSLGEIDFQMPAVDEISKVTVRLELLCGSKSVCENHWDFWVYPKRLRKENFEAKIVSVGNIRGLAELYPEIKSYEKGESVDLVLAATVDDALDELLNRGIPVILLSSQFQLGRIKTTENLTERHKTSFVRAGHAIFTAFPEQRRVDWKFHELRPLSLMEGICRPLIGYFREWEYIGAAMAEFRHKKSSILVTTLDFHYLGIDPASDILLTEMIRYTLSD